MAQLPHRAETNPTRARARARRNLSLVVGWGATLLLVFWLTAGGPAIAVLPLAVIAVLLVSNTIQVVKGDGPETHAIAPDALAEVATDGERIEVPATRAPDHRERGRRRGTIVWEHGRLSFLVDPSHTVRRREVVDELSAVELFDVAPRSIDLGAPPSWMHPQLRMTIERVDHVVEFTMPGDLAAGMLGSVCARAWYDQLAELGASTPASRGNRRPPR